MFCKYLKMIYNVLRKNISVFKKIMLTMTFTNIKPISCSLYKQKMKYQEQKFVCAHISIYNLIKKCFFQFFTEYERLIRSIIFYNRKNTCVMFFFLTGGIICGIANSTSSFYIRPLQYKLRNQFQLKPEMIEKINYIDKFMSY